MPVWYMYLTGYACDMYIYLIVCVCDLYLIMMNECLFDDMYVWWMNIQVAIVYAGCVHVEYVHQWNV